jgi:hypothetical protein
MSQFLEDNRGHRYIDVGNVRVTFIPQSSWAETGHGLRNQAYRDEETRALFITAPNFISVRSMKVMV